MELHRMFWVIEQNLHKEAFYDKLLTFFDKVEIPYQLVKCVPFSGELIPQPIPTQKHVITIGTYSMALRAKEYGWIPGAFVNDNFDYRVWSKAYEGYCLNSPAIIVPFKDVPEQTEEFFIRPCADTKAFTGTVMNWKEYSEWLPKVIAVPEQAFFVQELRADTMVLVSEPRVIQAEYRFICVDGKVITGSMYKSGNTPMQQECTSVEIIEFAQKIVDIWTPDRAFALDIAMVDGVLYVLEMGCMNAAGLYHCDIQKIVMAIEEMKF